MNVICPTILLIDLDECVSSPCHMNASCSNTKGSFNCVCNPGYTGNGFECNGMPFWMEDTQSCYHVVLLISIDLNECIDDTDGCEDGCENTLGSFFCTCPSFGSGFRANGTRCVGMYLSHL